MIFVVLHFSFSNMLSCFNFFWTYKNDFENFYFVVATEGSFLLFYFSLQSLFIHSSCSLTDEASKTAVIVSKIINRKFLDNFSDQIFQKFLLQNQYRNLKLETLFFVIDWKLSLAVSLLGKNLNIIWNWFFLLDCINNCELSDYNMSICTSNIQLYIKQNCNFLKLQQLESLKNTFRVPDSILLLLNFFFRLFHLFKNHYKS